MEGNIYVENGAVIEIRKESTKNSSIQSGGTSGTMDLTRRIHEIKQQFQAASVEKRLMDNRKNFERYTSRHSELAELARKNGGMLSTRIVSPQMIINGREIDFANEEVELEVEVVVPSTSVKLPHLEKIPRYNTWTFWSKNHMMNEKDSVIGKKMIYYKDGGVETLVYSDSEEDTAEPAEPKKHEFTEEEDHILQMADKEFGLTTHVLKILKQFVGASIPEIQGRCNILNVRNQEWPRGFLGNRLSEALDTFDTLFCRRCLVFDCHLHGCSQVLISSSEKRPYLPDSEDENTPCGDQCHLLEPLNLIDLNSIPESSSSKKLLRSTLPGVESSDYWKPIEKDLVLKGMEMFGRKRFGRKSCLIARNLLPGLKSCKEVFSYLDNLAADNGRINNEHMVPNVAKMAKRGRAVGKKRGNRKVKFSLKSTSNSRKNIGDKNEDTWKHYTPCECKPVCGKECPCLVSELCCEKYCGCSKRCKNRFRGCHCSKSLCQSKQCPCFNALRECDPDVCRNCWISCGGDLSLGEPPRQGDGPCENMKLLLKQKQRILLGRSDVCGWGAFTKNPLKKDDFLGEYTGEMINHREADLRGRVYDRIDTSYLFNLNDQYVLDAYRGGDKLKFANHSFEPNCHAKVTFAGGDHKIGIYASENIEAGEELFYDYQYLPGTAPPWAKKPDASHSPKGPPKKHPY